MTSSGPRFCPRCGTARIGEMGFCPKCGLDLAQLPDEDRPAVEPPAAVAPDERWVSPTPTAAAPDLPSRRRPGLRTMAPVVIVAVLLLAGAWLIGLGPFARSGPLGGGAGSATPTAPLFAPVTAPPSVSLAPGITAPPVGLRILSPADGAVVGTSELTVIGSAPPGLRITQDISFGFDRHATADGTGHWAIQIPLSEGQNELKFRIGDDPSTTQAIHVTYVPPTTP